MARRTRVVTITDEGRDKGKQFVITELPAEQGEWWAFRALAVVGNARLPEGAMDSAMAALGTMKGEVTAMFVAGLRMLPGVDVERLKPLMDEMMGCVQYQPPMAGMPPQFLLEGPLSQVEEIATRLKLRAEWIELHLGFSLAGFGSTTATPPPAPAS